jgi:hypothetical protein
MRPFIVRQQKTILWQAVQSSAIVSIFVYLIFRLLLVDFPMTRTGEFLFFLKTYSFSTVITTAATAGIASIYVMFVKFKRYYKALV